MMAPAGTWAHWFWTSRALHLTVTMSTLTLVALFTFVENYRRTSPYADMLPALSEAAAHPIAAARAAAEVVRLTEHQRSMAITERRQQRVDDVAKRAMYRKAHGMDETVGFGSNGGLFSRWGGKDKNTGPVAPVRNEDSGDVSNPPVAAAAAAVVDDASPVRGVAPVSAGTDAPRKKFLGIF